MNILYLASEPRIDLSRTVGHTTHILKTIQAFENAGHYVLKVIAGERKTAQQAKQRFRSIKNRLPSAISVMLRDVYALLHDKDFFRYCCIVSRKTRFDFIYERASPYHRTGPRLSEALQIPLILEVNSPIEEMVAFYGCARTMLPVATYVERFTAMKAQAIIAGSAAMRSYLIARGISAEKIYIIYPTAGEIFFEGGSDGSSIRRKLCLEDKRVVGFVGSMAAWHRVDLLLRAALGISRIASDIHFLIVGDGRQMADLRQYVSTHQLHHSVTFTGRVPHEEVPDYCSAMDICVIPNATWYGSPTKLFEYAAVGKPVIGPRIGPIQEFIRHGENGLLTKTEDVEDLIRQILTLTKNPVLAQKLGLRLRREILSEQTWEKNVQKILAIFAAVQSRPFSREIRPTLPNLQ